MTKLIFTMFLGLLVSVCFAQVTISVEEYDGLKESARKLEGLEKKEQTWEEEKKELEGAIEKLTSDLKAEKEGRKDDKEAWDTKKIKLETDNEKLTKDLEAEKEGRKDDKAKSDVKIEELNGKLGDANSDKSSSKKEFDKLQGDYNDLQEKYATLEEKHETLKKEKSSMKKLQEENKEWQEKFTNLETDLGRKVAEIEKLTKERDRFKVDSENKTSEITDLEADITSKESDITRLIQEKKEANEERDAAKEKLDPTERKNQRLVAENNKLKEALTKDIPGEVEDIIDGNDYIVGRSNAEKLLKRIEGVAEDCKCRNTTLKGPISKLTQYKELCKAMIDSEGAINKTYSNSVKTALNNLNNVRGHTDKQKKDILKYKELLGEYCTNYNLFADKIDLANTFGTEIQLANRVLTKAKTETDIKKYSYLVGEIDKKMKKSSHLNPAPKKVSCN